MSAADPQGLYQNAQRGAQGGFPVTPNDATDQPYAFRGIAVAAAGDVKVKMANGDTVTWPALVAGVIHKIEGVRIFATGTTATGIVAAR